MLVNATYMKIASVIHCLNQGSLGKQKLYKEYTLIEDLLDEIGHIHSSMAVMLIVIKSIEAQNKSKSGIYWGVTHK